MSVPMMIVGIIVVVGVVAIATSAYYEERRRMLDWHHKMMLDAFQEGWDAACSMMEYRKENNDAGNV